MTGTVICRRCGDVSFVRGGHSNLTSPYCMKCRTEEELRSDLGCDDGCTMQNPFCLSAPSGFKCPGGIF